MNEKSSEEDNGLKINASDEVPIEEYVNADSGIVAKVTSTNNIAHIGFPITTSSGFIIKTAFESAGVKYTLEEARIHAEKYERARGIGKGGYKFKVGASPSGSADVEIENTPVWEMKAMADLIYKRERST